MSVVKVIVSGRSGSGKTTVINFIKSLVEDRGWNAVYMRDYDILYEMFQEDIKKKGGKFDRAAYRGFKVVDYSVFDEALEMLEKQVRGREQTSRPFEKKEILLIEFARSNYQEALRTFNNGFLQDAYFFYVEADVNTCVQRIEQRVTSCISEKQPEECHYVPEEILRTYFDYDDWDYMAHHFKDNFKIRKEVVAYRNNGSYMGLVEQIKSFVNILFREEGEYLTQDKAIEKKINTGELEGMKQIGDMEQMASV